MSDEVPQFRLASRQGRQKWHSLRQPHLRIRRGGTFSCCTASPQKEVLFWRWPAHFLLATLRTTALAARGREVFSNPMRPIMFRGRGAGVPALPAPTETLARPAAGLAR